jgi:hypothetical protein
MMEEGAEDFEIARSVEFGGGEAINGLRRSGEIRVDLDEIGVADDKERRILQRGPVAQELVVGFCEIRMATLVFKGEASALPDIRPSISPTLLLSPPLKAEEIPVRITLGRLRMPCQFAQVEEMLLVGGTLRERNTRPLFNEFSGGNCHWPEGSLESLDCSGRVQPESGKILSVKS